MGKKSDISKNSAAATKSVKTVAAKPAKKAAVTAKQPVAKATTTAKLPVKKTVKTTAKKTVALPSYSDIALRAYFIAEARLRSMQSGDDASDWIEAERQLIAEANKSLPKK